MYNKNMFGKYVYFIFENKCIKGKVLKNKKKKNFILELNKEIFFKGTTRKIINIEHDKTFIANESNNIINDLYNKFITDYIANPYDTMGYRQLIYTSLYHFPKNEKLLEMKKIMHEVFSLKNR